MHWTAYRSVLESGWKIFFDDETEAKYELNVLMQNLIQQPAASVESQTLVPDFNSLGSLAGIG